MKADEVLLRGQARTVEEAAEAWGETQAELDRLESLERVIDDLTRAASFSEQRVDAYWEALFSGKIRDVLRIGDLLRETTGRTARAYAQFLGAVQAFESAGYVVDGAAEFRRAADAMRRLADDLEARWPRFDPEALDRGLAQAAQGQSADLADVYHEFPELQNKAGP